MHGRHQAGLSSSRCYNWYSKWLALVKVYLVKIFFTERLPSNDITKRNVNETAEYSQLRQIAPSLTFSPNQGGNKLSFRQQHNFLLTQHS